MSASALALPSNISFFFFFLVTLTTMESEARAGDLLRGVLAALGVLGVLSLLDCSLFSLETLRNALVFRGGSAALLLSLLACLRLKTRPSSGPALLDSLLRCLLLRTRPSDTGVSTLLDSLLLFLLRKTLPSDDGVSSASTLLESVLVFRLRNTRSPVTSSFIPVELLDSLLG